MLLTNSFEGGTDGTVISTANSGGASGTAWDFVSTGAGITKEFDSAQAFGGSLSGLLATGGTAVTALFEWSTAIGLAKAEVWGRLFFRLGTIPDANFNLLDFQDGATDLCRIRFNSTGKISITNSAFSIVATSATTFEAGTWYKIDYHFKFSATIGESDVLIYTDPNSSTPAETLSHSNQNYGASQTSRLRIGYVSTQANRPNLWLDGIELNDTGFPGAVPKASSDSATATEAGSPVTGTLDLNNSFEGGNDEVDISTANSGGASGTAWSFVQIGTNTTVKYDTFSPKNGAVSGRFATGADAVTAHVIWESSVIGTKSELYGRTYFRLDDLPASNINIIDFLSGSTGLVRFRLNAAGTITVTDTNFAVVQTSTTVFAVDTWYRLEWRFGFGVSTGSYEVRIFTDPDSGTPAETLTGSNKAFGAATANRCRFGHLSGQASLPAIWLDDVNINDHAFPGAIASTNKSSSDTATATESAGVGTAALAPIEIGVHAWYEAEGLGFAASYDRFDSQCDVAMDHYHGYHNPIPTSMSQAYGLFIPRDRPPLNSEQNMKTDWKTNADPATHVGRLNTLMNDIEANAPNMKVTFTFNHEPENDTASPSTDLATAQQQASRWRAHFLALARAVWTRNNPKFRVAITVQGFSGQRRVSNGQRISPWLPPDPYWNPEFTAEERAKVIVCSDTYPRLNASGDLVSNNGDLDMHFPAQAKIFDDYAAMGYTLFGFSEFAINCDAFTGSFANETKVRDYLRGHRDDGSTVTGSLGHYLKTTPYNIVHFSYYERSFVNPDNVSGTWHWIAISQTRMDGWEQLTTDLRTSDVPSVVDISGADTAVGISNDGTIVESPQAPPPSPAPPLGPVTASKESQRYTYTIFDILSNKPLVDVPLFGVQVSRKLSDAGYFQGIFKLDSTGYSNSDMMEAVQTGRSGICMRRHGVPIWAGPITSTSYSSQAKNVTISAASFEYFAARRKITSSFIRKETDQFTIFFDLWDLLQSGPAAGYGIQVPTPRPVSSVLKSVDISATDEKRFRQVIDDIAVADDGFDWIINVVDVDHSLQKTLQVGYPQIGAIGTEIVFEYPGNITNYYYTERIAEAATHFYLQGDGEGDTTLTSLVVQQDLVDGGFPRYDEDDQLKLINTQKLLDSRARIEGLKRRPPIGVATVFLKGDLEPEFGSWALGDSVKLVLKDARFPQGLQIPGARPLGWDLTPASSESSEKVSLTFEGGEGGDGV